MNRNCVSIVHSTVFGVIVVTHTRFNISGNQMQFRTSTDLYLMLSVHKQTEQVHM